MPGGVTPTSSDQRLIDMPSVASAFPIVFDTGGRWDKITAHCAICETQIAMDHVHGQVTWPLPTVADLEALAWCAKCAIWSRIRIRMRDDMSFDGPVPGNEKKWGRWEAKKSMIAQIRRAISSILVTKRKG